MLVWFKIGDEALVILGVDTKFSGFRSDDYLLLDVIY